MCCAYPQTLLSSFQPASLPETHFWHPAQEATESQVSNLLMITLQVIPDHYFHGGGGRAAP